MDSKRRQEEPSTQNAKRSNYAAKYKREHRSQQLATLQPNDKAQFLAKEAQRKRGSRARKKSENECRSTLQPADRAAFLGKEAQRKRESRARKRTTSTTVAIETVSQAPVVNDESTDKSLSDTEDNDPHFDVLWYV